MAVAAVAIIAGYNVYMSQNNLELSDLTLANVEAFANNGEYDTPYYVWPCYSGPGSECRSSKYDENNKCAKLTYC